MRIFSCKLIPLMLLGVPVFASSVCPAPDGGSVGGESVSSSYIANTVISGGVVQNNTGCNLLITFNANGSITTTTPNGAISYDAGDDDNLIGIINKTGKAISSLMLSSNTYDIFGFDGDGVCGDINGNQTTTAPGFTFVGGGNPCSHSTDPSGYGGPYTSLVVGSNDYTGTAFFGNGGIAVNGSTWFALEGPVDLSIVVSTSPEPAPIALFGVGICAVYYVRRRRG